MLRNHFQHEYISLQSLHVYISIHSNVYNFTLAIGSMRFIYNMVREPSAKWLQISWILPEQCHQNGLSSNLIHAVQAFFHNPVSCLPSELCSMCFKSFVFNYALHKWVLISLLCSTFHIPLFKPWMSNILKAESKVYIYKFDYFDCFTPLPYCFIGEWIPFNLNYLLTKC